MKRIFDFTISLLGLLVLLPIFIIISLFIKISSKGPIFFKQVRITQNGKEFYIYKFRTMYVNNDNQSQLTIGADKRITGIGKILRKFKIDELPQLINVINGEMSLVGPRPEVPKYVKYYTESQREILKVKAGITDYASIYFSNENEILGNVEDPEKYYIEKIIPLKIKLNKKYINEANLLTDIKIIMMTILKICGYNYKLKGEIYEK